MKYIITFAMCLFLMCSCDNHDFELSEKEQVFYINQMLHFSIEPWDSLSKAYSYDFFLRDPKPCKEVDTIYLEKKIPNKFDAIESSSYTREYNCNPSFIKLLPNTQYIVAHTGMGGRINIFKYYYTDSLSKSAFAYTPSQSPLPSEPCEGRAVMMFIILFPIGIAEFPNGAAQLNIKH